jgi:hypothetical protein
MVEQERRKSLRFLQRRPVIVITRSVGESVYLRSLVTRDFSPEGAFVLADHRPPVGTPVHIRMPLVLRGVALSIDFEIEATVVRREAEGMAIRFEQVTLACGDTAAGPLPGSCN